MTKKGYSTNQILKPTTLNLPQEIHPLKNSYINHDIWDSHSLLLLLKSRFTTGHRSKLRTSQ